MKRKTAKRLIPGDKLIGKMTLETATFTGRIDGNYLHVSGADADTWHIPGTRLHFDTRARLAAANLADAPLAVGDVVEVIGPMKGSSTTVKARGLIEQIEDDPGGTGLGYLVECYWYPAASLRRVPAAAESAQATPAEQPAQSETPADYWPGQQVIVPDGQDSIATYRYKRPEFHVVMMPDSGLRSFDTIRPVRATPGCVVGDGKRYGWYFEPPLSACPCVMWPPKSLDYEAVTQPYDPALHRVMLLPAQAKEPTCPT